MNRWSKTKKAGWHIPRYGIERISPRLDLMTTTPLYNGMFCAFSGGVNVILRSSAPVSVRK